MLINYANITITHFHITKVKTFPLDNTIKTDRNTKYCNEFVIYSGTYIFGRRYDESYPCNTIFAELS